MGSRIMNFKGLAIFVLCFVGIQGCFNESLMKRFNATDLDQDGFLTKDEVCQALGKVQNVINSGGILMQIKMEKLPAKRCQFRTPLYLLNHPKLNRSKRSF